jgi:hypothetical protein
VNKTVARPANIALWERQQSVRRKLHESQAIEFMLSKLNGFVNLRALLRNGSLNNLVGPWGATILASVVSFAAMASTLRTTCRSPHTHAGERLIAPSFADM